MSTRPTISALLSRRPYGVFVFLGGCGFLFGDADDKATATRATDGATQGGLSWGDPDPDPAEEIEAPVVVHLMSIEHEAMSKPNRLALGADGRVYVSDPGAGVHVIDQWGGYTQTLTTVATPLGLAMDSSGELLVSDVANGRIVNMSTDGVLGTEYGGTNEVFGGQAIAVDDSSGDVWVTDSSNHTIVVYNSSGELQSTFGSKGTGDGEFLFPAGIHIDDTDVYISDAINGRIQVFDLAGTHIRSISQHGDDAGDLMRPMGLVLDSTDRVWVAVALQSAVEVIGNTEAAFGAWVGELGEDPGTLHAPHDVLIDSYNRLWVTSMYTGRVEVWGIDSYTDPEPPPPPLEATASISPSNLNMKSSASDVNLFLDVPESEGTVLPESMQVGEAMTVNLSDGIVATNVTDDDGTVWEAQLRIEQAALKAAYPEDGTYDVTVKGSLDDENFFEGIFTLTIKGAE